MRDHILFYLNGVPQRISGDAVFETLSRFVRNDLRATGTKIVCEEGDCGACTVLIGRPEDGKLRYRAVNSCIQFLFQLDLSHVITVEGLGRDGQLTPVQDAMVRCHGAQCGYCTPGFIMAMHAIFEERSHCSPLDAQKGLTGNLCRCTGYEPIIKAAVDVKKQPRVEETYPSAPILRELTQHASEPVRVGVFFKPTSLAEAVAFKAANPKCTIVQGATDVGVWRNKRDFMPSAVLSLSGLPGLDQIRIHDGHLEVGGRVTLAAFEEFVARKVPELSEIMDRFGSPQIKNAGTLAGNIANASPIADTLPFLYVTDARLELTGQAGVRMVPINSFYRGYKTLDLAADEIITKIIVPLPRREETLRLYKVSKRSHLDISSFTAAMLMGRDGDRITSMRIACGGVGPVVLRLPRTESFLSGKAFTLASLDQAGSIAREEIAPISDVRGSAEFRLQLAENIFRRFYYECS
jgi:xanthine dehydrogenase small subunit